MLILLMPVVPKMKKYHKNWKDFLLEGKSFADFDKGKDQWTDLPADELKNPDNTDLSHELYDLISTAYAKIGGNFDFQSPEDIPADHDIWTAVNTDDDPEPDATRIGKTKPAGTKLTASGHDGTRAGINAYINKTAEMLNQEGFYAEMSKGIAHMMIKYHKISYVDNKEDVEKVLGKKIEWLGEHPEGKYPGYDGWYVRHISGHEEMKILLGKPKI